MSCDPNVILQCKGHGEIGLTMLTAKPTREHVNTGLEWKRTGLIDQMSMAEVSCYGFPSKLFKVERAFRFLKCHRDFNDRFS